MTRNIYEHLPRVIAVTSIEDGGPDGTACCPHCGAQGRYIFHFLAEDGKSYGAMKGCFHKFPKHPLAAEAADLLERQQERQRRGQQLNGWDEAALAAILDYAEHRISEDQAMEIVRTCLRYLIFRLLLARLSCKRLPGGVSALGEKVGKTQEVFLYHRWLTPLPTGSGVIRTPASAHQISLQSCKVFSLPKK